MRVFPFLMLSTVFAGLVHAESADSPLAAMKETDAHLAEYSKVSAEVKAEGNPVKLMGWLVGDRVHKIVAKSGGDTTTYYLEGNAPVAVMRTFKVPKSDAHPARTVEETLLLEDGAITKWDTDVEVMGVPHAEDYQATEEQLRNTVPGYVKALAAKQLAQALKGAKTIEGTFAGIEEGDYAHWKMRTKDGGDFSAFILEVYPAVQAVLEAPAKFEGRKCRVFYKTAKEGVPEAGGTAEIDRIISVDWL